MQSTDRCHRSASLRRWRIHHLFPWVVRGINESSLPSELWSMYRLPFGTQFPIKTVIHRQTNTLASSSQSSFSSRSCHLQSMSTFFLWEVMTSFWMDAALYALLYDIRLPLLLGLLLKHASLVLCGISIRSDLYYCLRSLLLNLFKESYWHLVMDQCLPLDSAIFKSPRGSTLGRSGLAALALLIFLLLLLFEYYLF